MKFPKCAGPQPFSFRWREGDRYTLQVAYVGELFIFEPENRCTGLALSFDSHNRLHPNPTPQTQWKILLHPEGKLLRLRGEVRLGTSIRKHGGYDVLSNVYSKNLRKFYNGRD